MPIQTLSLFSRYETPAEIIEAYNANKTTAFAKQPERCFNGIAPTLEQIDTHYGNGTAEMIILSHVNAVNETSGIRTKMTAGQVQKVCEALRELMATYKVTEVILFFWRFSGLQRYERFYGSVDGDKIIRAFYEFKAERNAWIDSQKHNPGNPAHQQKLKAYYAKLIAENNARREKARVTAESKQG